MTSDYILKIFRSCIPHMPKTAAKFGNELQRVLQPMVIKPTTFAGLAVSCMSPFSVFISNNYHRLYKKR